MSEVAAETARGLAVVNPLEVVNALEPELLPTGAEAPPFSDLTGVDGGRYGLASFGDRRLLAIIFTSNRCPTVKAYEPRLGAFQDRFGPAGVQIVAINSNDPHLYPDEAFAPMVVRAAEGRYAFPYLSDPTQRVGWAFGAQRTFHVFLLDEARRLRYDGRFDDSRLPELVTTHDLVAATEALLEGRAVSVARTKPFGCSLDYFGLASS